jgi:hypothetical protein
MRPGTPAVPSQARRTGDQPGRSDVYGCTELIVVSCACLNLEEAEHTVILVGDAEAVVVHPGHQCYRV